MTLRHLLLVCGGCRCSRARYCRAAATERAATHSCVLNTVVATLKGDKEWLNGHQCFIVQKKEEGYGWTSAAFGRLCFLLCFPKERSAGMAMPTLLVAVRSKPPSGARTETAPASCLSLCSWVENQDSSNIQTRELGLPLNSPHPEPKSNRQHSEQSIKQFAVFSKFHSSSDTQTKHCLSQLCWRPVALFRRWMSFSPYFLHHARSHVHTVICMLWYWELMLQCNMGISFWLPESEYRDWGMWGQCWSTEPSFLQCPDCGWRWVALAPPWVQDGTWVPKAACLQQEKE